MVDQLTPAFGIYVHWPFCLSKCPYCDFNSHVAEDVEHGRWRAALLRELDHYANETAGREVTSVFFGGGTPSLMEPATVAAVLDRVAGRWTLGDAAEITLEANPGTVDAARFRGFRDAGVNRLSLGVQSLDDADLRFLGRRHDAAEALAGIALAREVFPRISFDLIYARPGQTVAGWRDELARAIALAADHLSLYQLTIEKGTAFHPAHARGDFALPAEDIAVDLYDATQAITAAAGLPAYEVSNHARPGAECRHNLLYWRGDDYVGVGPGAHGRLTRGGIVRATRQRRAPARWLDEVETGGHGTRERVVVTAAQRAEELLMMGLRLTEGVESGRFARLAGRPLAAALDAGNLDRMREGGFVAFDGHRLTATPRGILVLDRVLAELLA